MVLHKLRSIKVSELIFPLRRPILSTLEIYGSDSQLQLCQTLPWEFNYKCITSKIGPPVRKILLRMNFGTGRKLGTDAAMLSYYF